LFFLLLVLLATSLACNLSRFSATPATTIKTPTAAVPLISSPSPITAASPAIPSNPTPAPGAKQGTPVATANATQAQALVLPGLKVAYIKEGNVWLWKESRPLQLTSSGRDIVARLSPDGEVVAFSRGVDDFHIELFAVNVDGSNERRLVSVANLDTIGGGVRDSGAVAINPYHFEWIPGTRLVAFNSYQAYAGSSLTELDDLNQVNVDTGELKLILLAGWGGEFAYSPDGKQVAISKSDSVILCNADGTNYRKVLDYTPVLTYSEYRYYAQPFWSPDGDFLRLAIPPTDPLAEPRQPTTLWRIDMDGKPAYPVGNIPAIPPYDNPVAFAPNLQYLAYLKEIGLAAENMRELHIARGDGSGDWVYQKGKMLQFYSWSTDSRRFAFSLDEDAVMQLGSLDATPSLFASDAIGIMVIHWVDAKRVLYLKQKDRFFDLCLATQDEPPLVLDTIAAPPPDYDFYIPVNQALSQPGN
jgi:hypothetical protein